MNTENLVTFLNTMYHLRGIKHNLTWISMKRKIFLAKKKVANVKDLHIKRVKSK